MSRGSQTRGSVLNWLSDRVGGRGRDESRFWSQVSPNQIVMRYWQLVECPTNSPIWASSECIGWSGERKSVCHILHIHAIIWSHTEVVCICSLLFYPTTRRCGCVWPFPVARLDSKQQLAQVVTHFCLLASAKWVCWVTKPQISVQPKRDSSSPRIMKSDSQTLDGTSQFSKMLNLLNASSNLKRIHPMWKNMGQPRF